MRNAMWVGGGITGMGEIPILGVREKGIAKVIRDIFRNGEQGFFYDPNDLSTMYQDSTGTVPVTAAGQPVGLILDKSKWLVRSPVTLINSSFDSGISGWVAGPSLTATWNNGEARIVGTGSIESIVNTLRSNVPGTANKLYKISFDATWVSGGYLQAGVPYREGLRVLPTENAGIKKRYTCQVALHPVSPYNICCFAAESGAVWLIDNVSVEEIRGNHAFQTNSASRPILRKNAVTGANYLEFDGTDDFLVTSSIDFTVTDKISLFAGVVKLANRGSMLCELSANTNTELGSFYITAPESSGGTYAFKSRGQSEINPGPVTSSGTSAYDVSVLSAFGNISGGDNTLRRNAESRTAKTNLGSGNLGNHPLYIGRRGGISLPFNGHVYSLIGVGRLATDSKIAAIEKELAKRTGVTLSV